MPAAILCLFRPRSRPGWRAQPDINAHKESVSVALNAVEDYTQARLGGGNIPETTQRWIVAKFHHDTARADQKEQYVALQLHTHSVVFKYDAHGKR